jgi:hypothetical protein
MTASFFFPFHAGHVQLLDDRDGLFRRLRMSNGEPNGLSQRHSSRLAFFKSRNSLTEPSPLFKAQQ